ncbi:TPA: hypothetical protein DIV48_03130 [Candidatus Kaiserbacteria bacterium]|nr:MAG: hypothetical protein UY93_C0003G0106 [Parcubacteria group bacterium GW2011_GWA1_56_13]KKW46923.1 MAG: hypothetical protein UY97_C0002G0034 [Parcubacteria group bacterium GW2011_GWB1_57_6]HCR52607.1 hypothetical protein [Candidatus Kaiserbacteria bacterium]
MIILATLISILGVTALVWLASRFLPLTVCPICAGVFLTWVGLLVAYLLDYPIPQLIPALLMGGSVVGVTSLMEKRFTGPAGTLLTWKTFFIVAGFLAAYAVLERLWGVFVGAAAFLIVISFVLLMSSNRAGAAVDIEKQMKDCC